MNDPEDADGVMDYAAFIERLASDPELAAATNEAVRRAKAGKLDVDVDGRPIGLEVWS